MNKLVKGDISLISALGAVQLVIAIKVFFFNQPTSILQATQAAISQAFQTPEVIKLFGKREPKQLRERLQEVEQDFKLNKLSYESSSRQKVLINFAFFKMAEFQIPDLRICLNFKNEIKVKWRIVYKKINYK